MPPLYIPDQKNASLSKRRRRKLLSSNNVSDFRNIASSQTQRRKIRTTRNDPFSISPTQENLTTSPTTMREYTKSPKQKYGHRIKFVVFRQSQLGRYIENNPNQYKEDAAKDIEENKEE